MEATKHCAHCNQDLPLSAFYSDKKTKSGLTAYCKAYYASYYTKNRDRQLKSTQRARIKRRYGLTLDEYTALLTNGCMVCGSTYQMNIDHCHATGSVRGVLCSACNRALGCVDDDPERLEALAAYLREKRHISQGLIGPSY